MKNPQDLNKKNPSFVEQGIRDVLSGIAAEDGGWNPQGKLHPLRGPLDADGRRIILWSAKSGVQHQHPASEIKPLGKEHPAHAHIEYAFRQIESAVMLRFVEHGSQEHASLHKKIPSLKSMPPQIRFFTGKIEDDTHPETGEVLSVAGYALPDAQSQRWEVMLRNDPPRPDDPQYMDELKNTVMHEIGHALGLSHPGSATGLDGVRSGFNEKYSRNHTILSYNFGNLEAGLTGIDIGALQFLYGEAMQPEKTLTETDLPEMTFLASSNPAQLDLRGSGAGGYLHLGNYTNEHEPKIYGELTKNGQMHQIGVRLGPKWGFSEARLDGTRVKGTMKGGEEPNHFVGGEEGDELCAYGGRDVLTGGGGGDYFIFDEKSGFGNRVTDFSEDDSLWLHNIPGVRISAPHQKKLPPHGRCTLRLVLLNDKAHNIGEVEFENVSVSLLLNELHKKAGGRNGLKIESLLPLDKDRPFKDMAMAVNGDDLDRVRRICTHLTLNGRRLSPASEEERALCGSMLTTAIARNSLEILEYLLDSGISPNQPLASSGTAHSPLSASNSEECYTLLLKRGARFLPGEVDADAPQNPGHGLPREAMNTPGSSPTRRR